jgi:hypothetical protein
MKNFLYGLLAVVLTLPSVSFAASADSSGTSFASGAADGGEFGTFLTAVLGFIDTILIPLVLGIAFLAFIWGVFKFFILGGSDSEKQTEGKSLMIYAVAGFVLILSFYGLVNFFTDGIGFGGDTITTPGVPTSIADPS